jgi:pyridoxamine 5'-phosphate oxidase
MDRLGEVHESCWDLLEEGADSASSAFHTGVLGTVERGAPRLRTVVLRAVDRAGAVLYCHTDRRSGKIRQLAETETASWLFYDAHRRVQLRLEGTATVHSDDSVADERWAASAPGSRRCYLVSPGPGRVLASPGSTLPETLRGRRPSAEEAAPGRDNFAVIATRVHLLDWLHLTADGHRRARFRRGADCWERHWIAP